MEIDTCGRIGVIVADAGMARGVGEPDLIRAGVVDHPDVLAVGEPSDYRPAGDVVDHLDLVDRAVGRGVDRVARREVGNRVAAADELPAARVDVDHRALERDHRRGVVDDRVTV